MYYHMHTKKLEKQAITYTQNQKWKKKRDHGKHE